MKKKERKALAWIDTKGNPVYCEYQKGVKISKKEADNIIKRYFNSYPQLKRWRQNEREA